MSIKSAGSSVEKGESLKDTVLTLAAYEPAAIVVRHPHVGAPGLVARSQRRGGRERGRRHAPASDPGAARPLHDADDASAGSTGCTSRSSATSCTRVSPARSSRRSRLVGADATIVGPPALVPRALEALGCERSTEISAIESADVVYVLRMQRERMLAGANYVPSLREYTARWGITPERLRPGQKVMHPGPMNRGVEIDAAGRGLGGLARRRAGALGPPRPDGGAARPARARASGRRDRGGRVMLVSRNGYADSLTLEGRLAAGRCVTVTVSEGVIARIEPAGSSRAVLAPAFVDPHVHLRTPGREDEETIASGTAAAAAGGYCAILAMPNTDPVVDSATVLALAPGDRPPGGRDPGRLHGLDLEGRWRARS